MREMKKTIKVVRKWRGLHKLVFEDHTYAYITNAGLMRIQKAIGDKSNEYLLEGLMIVFKQDDSKVIHTFNLPDPFCVICGAAYNVLEGKFSLNICSNCYKKREEEGEAIRAAAGAVLKALKEKKRSESD